MADVNPFDNAIPRQRFEHGADNSDKIKCVTKRTHHVHLLMTTQSMDDAESPVSHSSSHFGFPSLNSNDTCSSMSVLSSPFQSPQRNTISDNVNLGRLNDEQREAACPCLLLWKKYMAEFVLSCYFNSFKDDFLECICDCRTANKKHFTLNKLQEFERNKIKLKAKFKHKQYEQFVQNYTGFTQYQSVFATTVNV